MEQSVRAERLQALGVVDSYAPERLSGARLAARIDAVMAAPGRRDAPHLDLDGAGNTARLLRRWL